MLLNKASFRVCGRGDNRGILPNDPNLFPLGESKYGKSRRHLHVDLMGNVRHRKHNSDRRRFTRVLSSLLGPRV